jgi:hypothetical protein
MSAIAALLVLSGCGSSPVVTGSAPQHPYDGPMQVAVSYDDEAGVEQRSGAAGLALECDGEPYNGGSGDYDSGLESAQGSAEDALRDFFDQEPIAEGPSKGYRVEREADGRVLYSFDVDGRTKVAVIAAADIRDYDDDTGWGVETWAQCDPAELPAAVTDDLGIQVWTDRAGHRVPVATLRSHSGPEHCDWQDIVFLTVVDDTGTWQFLRDRTGELDPFLATTYADAVAVPESAIDTGFVRDGRSLWLAKDRTAAYLVRAGEPGRAERWPATTEQVACA